MRELKETDSSRALNMKHKNTPVLEAGLEKEAIMNFRFKNISANIHEKELRFCSDSAFLLRLKWQIVTSKVIFSKDIFHLWRSLHKSSSLHQTLSLFIWWDYMLNFLFSLDFFEYLILRCVGTLLWKSNPNTDSSFQ